MFLVKTYNEIKKEYINYHADIVILTLPPKLLKKIQTLRSLYIKYPNRLS